MSTWIKLHDNFWENPKVLAAGEDAALLYVQGLSYCSRNLSDGAIPTPALRMLTAKRDARTLARTLVREGLWVETPTGWMVHDYLKHQRSKDEIEKYRSRSARRQTLHRNPELRERIKMRDGGKCRYCGLTVDWNDRRGPKGGTYDHVDPDGPDDETNLVVACRACNSGKRDGQRDPSPIENVSETSLPETEPEPETETPPSPLVEQIMDGIFAKELQAKQASGDQIRSVDGWRKWWMTEGNGSDLRQRAEWMVEHYEMVKVSQYVDAVRSVTVPQWAASMRREVSA